MAFKKFRDLKVYEKYMQKEIGMDFGFPNEMYRKPVYIDPSPDHPVICLTFDDGPQFRYEYDECTTVEIVDLLSEYDAQGTFYMIGIYLEDRDIWADYQVYTLFKKSYGNGNEFGSHTQSHANLIDLETAEEMKEEIDGPIDYMKEFMDYEMKTYRPVEGDFDETVINVQSVPAILWDVDSEDWLTRNPDTIYHQVMKYDYETGDIILFHDAYDETIEALEKIIPELIDRGCQLLTVTEMLKCLDIDPSLISYYYGPYYYE